MSNGLPNPGALRATNAALPIQSIGFRPSAEPAPEGGRHPAQARNR